MNSTINQQKKKNYQDGGGEKELIHELQSTKKQQLPTITSSPPSSTTSPSHEFSFTISLHSSSNEKTITNTNTKSKTPTPTTSPHNSFAIDLSPADDIFFHGHLLPLHLLSHLPISPRSSTSSLDSFTLPIKELGDDNKRPSTTTNTNTNTNNNNNSAYSMSSNNIYNNNTRENNGRIKAKSFSFLKFPRWQKGDGSEEKEKEMEKKQKKKAGLNMFQIIRRYAKMFRPLLFYKNAGKSSTRRETAGHFDFEREPYSSFSGNLSLRGGSNNNYKKESRRRRRRRGEFSAPASMWTSPTNSGLLLTTPLGVHSSSSESSMEELQSAIQAAIAHCKNSSTAIKEQEIKLQS